MAETARWAKRFLFLGLGLGSFLRVCLFFLLKKENGLVNSKAWAKDSTIPARLFLDLAFGGMTRPPAGSLVYVQSSLFVVCFSSSVRLGPLAHAQVCIPGLRFCSFGHQLECLRGNIALESIPIWLRSHNTPWIPYNKEVGCSWLAIWCRSRPTEQKAIRKARKALVFLGWCSWLVWKVRKGKTYICLALMLVCIIWL